MRKVTLKMNEQYKYEIIKELVDTNGNKKRAALKLHCSLKTIYRAITNYQQNGKEGFIHGNRGRLPSSAFSLEDKVSVVNYYMDHYGDANLQHFSEIVEHELGVYVSDSTINKWLREQFVLSPKARRKTKKDMKKLLKHQADATQSTKLKNKIKEAISIIDSEEAHPRRPRCKFFGEMIQMDASSYYWIHGEVWHLHVAIDDATGEVVGAYFDTQETLKGYYNVFYQILTAYGIPAMFYTDKRTVFEYKRKNTAFDDEDTFTQFSYACHQLGVEIKTTSVAQAKGRVERLNQSLQSRLPVELRRANIKNIKDANAFLNSYIKKYNKQFALHLNATKSVFETQPNNEKINQILSIVSSRKIQGGHCIKYKNKHYIPTTSNGSRMFFKNKTDCLIIEGFYGITYVNVLEELYYMDEIKEYEEYSRNFEIAPKEKKKKKQYIPPMTHPWKHASYLTYVNTMSHRKNTANV